MASSVDPSSKMCFPEIIDLYECLAINSKNHVKPESTEIKLLKLALIDTFSKNFGGRCLSASYLLRKFAVIDSPQKNEAEATVNAYNDFNAAIFKCALVHKKKQKLERHP